jgi:hypothetical protein
MHGSAIAAGDLNGDGILDLVVTNATPEDNADLAILLGVSGGGFEPARNLTLGSLSTQVFLVDMNHDGKLDLVEDGGVAFGDGHGSFGNLTPFPEGIEFNRGGTQLAVGDLNNDDIPDVVAIYSDAQTSTYQAWVFLNNGKGDFTANSLNNLIEPSTLDDGRVMGVAIGKLQGNNADIVLGDSFGYDDFPLVASAIILVGDGKGNFQIGNEIYASNSGGYGYGVTIGDFNDDGYPDIGILAGQDFTVFTGPSFANQAPARAATFITTPGGSYHIDGNFAVADFNGDGWPDVVTTNPYGVARLYNVPVPIVSPGSLTFTSSGTKTVSIRNTTKLRQSITANTSAPFRISANTCASLAPGASCAISVEFTPNGSYPDSQLSISANGALIATVALSGS